MEAITDPSTPAFLREVEAPSASPPLVLVSGEGEVFSAPSSPVLAPEGRGSHSSTLSVLEPVVFWGLVTSLALVEAALWLLSSG